MNRNNFPALEQFLGGYFHQDFLLDYGTPNEAIATFAREEPAKSVRAVCGELDRVLLLIRQDRENPQRVLQELGCYYDPAGDGVTITDWLEHVRKELECK